VVPFPTLTDAEEFLEANLPAPRARPRNPAATKTFSPRSTKSPRTTGAVVLLVDVEEFAYKDTAAILGIPIGNRHVEAQPRTSAVARATSPE